MLGLLLVFVSVLAFSAGQKDAAAKDDVKPVTLKLSTHHPADVSRSEGSRLLKEEIEKATNGKVKIDIYYNQSLAKGSEVLEAVRKKVVDIGDVNPAYYPGQLPLHAGILVYTKSPPKHSQKSEVMKNSYAKYPQLLAELENYNQKLLWQYFPGSLNLSSTKPVRSIGDFKGLKIRASSEVYLRMLKDLGAIPVSVPFNDCYMALQTGTIDGVFTNIEAMTGQKFYEPAPYSFTSEKLGLWLPFTFTINKDIWDGFSPAIQGQIKQAVEIVDKRFGPKYDEAYAAEAKIFREKGKEMVMAGDADVKIWQNLPILEELKKELIVKAEKAGIANGRQFVDDIEKFMDEAAKK
jgi:TRAP-type C4-dicarboxylate transport system substrate-binding protein